MEKLGSLISELEELTDGLWVISETDAPLKPFIWPDSVPFSAENILAAQGQSSESPVETISLADFFGPKAEAQEWHDDSEAEAAKRFAKLQKWLEKTVTEPHVYRIGEIQISVYIVGKVLERTIGLTTLLVET